MFNKLAGYLYSFRKQKVTSDGKTVHHHLLDQYPNYDSALVESAEMAFSAEEWESAAQQWTGLIESYPDKAYIRLYQIYHRLKQFDKASDMLQMALPRLEERAAKLPSMGGARIGEALRSAARETNAGHAIVEVGCWLGSGTAHLALGVLESGDQDLIHTYDRWVANPSECQKALRHNVKLRAGQDTLPLVKSFLDPFAVDIRFHQGDIRQAEWNGQPIGLYVDDAAKRPDAFMHVLKTFGPHWIPGETTLFLMDYGIWKKHTNDAELRFQKEFIENNPDSFELVAEHIAGTSCFMFKYTNPFRLSDLNW